MALKSAGMGFGMVEGGTEGYVNGVETFTATLACTSAPPPAMLDDGVFETFSNNPFNTLELLNTADTGEDTEAGTGAGSVFGTLKVSGQEATVTGAGGSVEIAAGFAIACAR